MSEFIFFVPGLKAGRLIDRERVRRIARDNGATYVRTVGPECECGYGCSGCKVREWFLTRNLGHPFDDATRDAVRAALRAAGLVEEMDR